MRFLCLHGSGTNSQIMEIQTAALRYELGDDHTYDFVDGMIPCPAAEGIRDIFPTDDGYFAYFDERRPETCKTALNDLAQFIQKEGPYDGVIGFSTGATLAATHLIQVTEVGNKKRGMIESTFKLAVFFSCGLPIDPLLLNEKDEMRFISTSEGDILLSLPTAHIWGDGDVQWAESSKTMTKFCAKNMQDIHVHGGGHEIPGTRDLAGLVGAVHAIKRTIDKALTMQ